MLARGSGPGSWRVRRIEVDGFEQLFLRDLFVGGVGDVDGAGAEEEGSPQSVSAGMSVVKLAIIVGRSSTLRMRTKGRSRLKCDVGAVAYDCGDGFFRSRPTGRRDE